VIKAVLLKSTIWIGTVSIAITGIQSFFGCNQPFDPRGPVDTHLVVFSVLSTDRNTQFVSVTAPFLPSGYGTSEFYSTDASVSDAVVTISGPGESYRLRDTILQRPSTSQFTSALRLYAANLFTPRYGAEYVLSVDSKSHGLASTSVVLPGKPTLSMVPKTHFRLLDPYQYHSDSLLEFSIELSAIAKGYIARLFIDFDVPNGAEWQRIRIEMPSSVGDSTYSLLSPRYPGLSECTTSDAFLIGWKLGYLKSIFKDVGQRYTSVSYRQVVLEVLQVEANLYSYCLASRVDRDPRSIRLDQPLYPRISGGSYGVVGGYTLDSLVFYPWGK
jgi:hypothetical protein